MTTWKSDLAKALRILTASIFMVLTLAALLGNTNQDALDFPNMNTAPVTTDPVGVLVNRHHCGNLPTGVIPGHAVVTLPGHAEPTYAGPRITGQALAQIDGGADHGLTVYAFCR